MESRPHYSNEKKLSLSSPIKQRFSTRLFLIIILRSEPIEAKVQTRASVEISKDVARWRGLWRALHTVQFLEPVQEYKLATVHQTSLASLLLRRRCNPWH